MGLKEVKKRKKNDKRREKREEEASGVSSVYPEGTASEHFLFF